MESEKIIEEAIRLVSEGVSVTFPVNGRSMLPFIIGGKESIIMQKPAELKIGDVIIMRMFDLSDEANQDDEVTDFMLIESLDTNGIMEWWESKGLN